MVLLAALDFLGTVLAKEWAEGRNHWLFAVYAVSLKVAELSTVTFGWIVTLQVGLLLLERIRYAVALANGKWAAIVAILVLQAHLNPGPERLLPMTATKAPVAAAARTSVIPVPTAQRSSSTSSSRRPVSAARSRTV